MSFHVTSALVPRDFSELALEQKNAVVIDVLRATTSIITALSGGALSVLPVATPEEAVQKKTPGALVCGEREGVRCRGFDLGNSPRAYKSELVAGKRIIFTSTNGSRMMLLVKNAGQVFLAAFINNKAVVQALVRSGRDCLIACSGEHGRFSLEDTVCAGMIVHALRRHMPDLEMDDESACAEILYKAHERNLLAMMTGSMHGRHLINLGFQDDLPFCAQTNRSDALPVLQGDAFVLSE